ncbi:MAG: thiamine phosphate synthase [Proteobacteria bacterium]|nr:thiamine phosphate synthase [Pseudomonadota bacterium]MBU1596722.1 thiamine phosphate synthase [Pseudomonadota bacterium]
MPPAPGPSGRPVPDLSLYLVTDRRLCGERSLLDVVGLAVRGGARVVQLREKRLDMRALVDLARALMGLLKPFGVPLIINDRVDAALAVGAAGVHLGQSDMPVELARHLLGPEAILGLSLERPEHLREAERFDLDYYGVSPLFPTATKPELLSAWGLDGLAALRRATRRPLVGIGGIGPDSAEAVIRAGADGVAVVSAICGAADPLRAAEALALAVGRARRDLP